MAESNVDIELGKREQQVYFNDRQLKEKKWWIRLDDVQLTNICINWIIIWTRW